MFYLIVFFIQLPLGMAQELPRQYITASPWDDTFSERSVHAPYQTLKPQPLQITSPYFENLFLGSTAIQSRSQGSPGTSIRGSSQAARVLFLLDNIPLNFLDGFGGSSQFIPTEILQQIHVFEGPTSALYGANAMGGSIHFIPQRNQRSLLRLGVSDTNGQAVEEMNSFAMGNVALVTPLVATEKDSLQTSVFLEKDQGNFEYKDADGTVSRRQNNSQSLQRFTVLGRHQRGAAKISHLLLYSELDKTSPGSLQRPLVTQQKSKALLAGLSAEVRAADNLTLVSRASYARLHSEFFDSDSSVSNSDKIWANQTISWEWAPGYFSQTLFDFNQNFYTASFVQDQKFDRSEPELAQSFVLPVTDSFFLEPSLRHLFRYNETLWQLQMPLLFENSRLWLMYSEGFRPPSLTDLFAQTTYFRGNPQLAPEKSQQYEMGQSWKYGPATLTSTVFFLRYKDLLQSSVLPSGEFTRINVGRADSHGMSVKFDMAWTHLQLHASHTYLLAREKPSQSPLRFSPENQSFLSLSFQSHRKNFWTLQQTFWSSFWDLDFVNNRNVKLSSWESTDLLWTHQGTENTSVQFGIYNLWNQRRELTFGYPEPQRRVALALETRF